MSRNSKSGLKDRFEGKSCTVVHCKNALKSFHEALQSVHPSKRKNYTDSMILQIQRLADKGRLSKEFFPAEGNLPKKKGQAATKKFNALKRKPIRGYCWKSETHENTYFISHYIKKDFDKLAQEDTDKVGNNWRRIEENGHEC